MSAKKLGTKLVEQFNTMGIQVMLKNEIDSPRLRTFFFDIKNPLDILKMNNKIIEVLKDFNKIKMEYKREEKYSFSITVPKDKPSELTQNSIAQPECTGRNINLNIGKDSLNEDVIINFDKTNHLLIAGTTGSGKSVLINTILYGIINNADQNEYDLKLIDPKRVSFNMFKNLSNVELITEIDDAKNLLESLINLMEERYQYMESKGLTDKNIFKPTFVVIDELAELMLVDRAGCETKLIRLLQKARQANIHMILATQRPTTEVISGLIKAQCDTRICLKMASSKDSVTVIDKGIGQRLLGYGDGFIKYPNKPDELRFQAAFTTDGQMNALIATKKAKEFKIPGGPAIVKAEQVILSDSCMHIANEKTKQMITKCIQNAVSWGMKLPTKIKWEEERSKKWLGLTLLNDPCIILNARLYTQCDEIIERTIYHELCHIIAGPEHEHDEQWEAQTKIITEHTGYPFTEHLCCKTWLL